MFSSNCCFLTCIQVSQETGQMVWYSHLFKNFPQFVVIHTVKNFGIVNKAEVDVFLELLFFFYDPMNVGHLTSDSSAFCCKGGVIWGYWYVSWKSWFQLVLHPAWHFTWMLSACKLNKQGDNIQPWCTPFPIWNQSVVPCPVLTVASWPAYGFLRRQVRWSGIPISLRVFRSLLWCRQSKALT